MYKIIAIDDHEDILNIIKAKLSKNGYDVLTLSDPAMLLPKIDEFHPDLIFLDIMMPKVTGFELFTAIKANKAHSKIKVVFLTAKDMDFTRKKSEELGADGFIPKPFSPQELLEFANKILGVKK